MAFFTSAVAATAVESAVASELVGIGAATAAAGAGGATLVTPVAASVASSGMWAGFTSAMSAAAPWLSAFGALTSAYGAISGGMQSNDMAKYQSKILQQQAERERLDAGLREDDFRRAASRSLATRRALLGASGVEASEGSPLAVTENMAGEAELQALRIRNGGAVNSSRLMTDADLTRLRGGQARSEGFGRGGALLLSGAGRLTRKGISLSDVLEG